MLLTHLFLRNFRNYTKSSFEFNSTTTLIIGPNTSGKTNILEAISLCSLGKSMRGHRSEDMVRTGLEAGSVKGELSNEITLEVIVTSGTMQGAQVHRKKLLVNRVARRSLDFIGQLKTSIFEPEDLELVHAVPSRRRSFLDNVLFQVDREYRRAHGLYDRALKSRNRILRRIKEEGRESDMDYWEDLLISNGLVITDAREKFIHFLNQQPQDFGKFFLEYDRSTVTAERFVTYHTAERVAGVTLIGPQRDDFIMFKDSEDRKPLAIFGSRGEQRMGVLWLKMGELAFLREVSGDMPILLLDDIFSELDSEHIRLVLKKIGDGQTIMTTTHREFIPKNFLQHSSVIELGNAKV